VAASFTSFPPMLTQVPLECPFRAHSRVLYPPGGPAAGLASLAGVGSSAASPPAVAGSAPTPQMAERAWQWELAAEHRETTS